MTAITSTPLGTAKRDAPKRRPAVPNGLYRVLLSVAVLVFIALLIALIVELAYQGAPAFAHFGFSFITGTRWNPARSQFSAFPFIVGTLETTAIAMVVAIPIGIGTALSLAYILPRPMRGTLSTAVELLAAVPSVIYGLWGLLIVAPWSRTIIEPAVGFIFGHSGPGSGPEIGIGLLLAGLILAVMVLPTMTAISRAVLAAVPADQIEGALALGATRWQTLWRVVVPHARIGILGAVTLSIGRAFGETMAVAMIIGNTPALAHSLFSTGATMASIIANQFTEANEPYFLTSLIAIAVLLMVMSVVVNFAARLLVRSVSRSRSSMVVV